MAAGTKGPRVFDWTGWHRHMTFAMTAQALLAITRARLLARPAASQAALAAFKKSRGLLAVAAAG